MFYGTFHVVPLISQPNLSSNRKIPWRLSRPQKARQRKRLRAVDAVVATIDAALAKQKTSVKVLERWKAEMPREDQMRAKDKYTFFDRKEKSYRKGVHSESNTISSNFSLLSLILFFNEALKWNRGNVGFAQCRANSTVFFFFFSNFVSQSVCAT